MNFRNAVFNRHGTVDMEIEHPIFGWIPFTASPDDPEEHGRELYEAVKATAAPYVAPPLPTPEEARAAMPALTSRQFWLAAVSIGVTKETVAATVDGLTISDADKAWMKVELMEATEFERLHPAVVDLAVALNIPPEQLDALWTWAGNL